MLCVTYELFFPKEGFCIDGSVFNVSSMQWWGFWGALDHEESYFINELCFDFLQKGAGMKLSFRRAHSGSYRLIAIGSHNEALRKSIQKIHKTKWVLLDSRFVLGRQHTHTHISIYPRQGTQQQTKVAIVPKSNLVNRGGCIAVTNGTLGEGKYTGPGVTWGKQLCH